MGRFDGGNIPPKRSLDGAPQDETGLDRPRVGEDSRYPAWGRMVLSMVKVSIFYPSRPDSHFDVDYYLNTHMPLAVGLLGKAVKAVSVEIGLLGGNPDQLPPFTAICGFTCESAQAFTDAFLPN